MSKPSEATEAILTAAQSVFDAEAAALRQIGADIPGDFVPAVQAILGIEGRVIVSGIGKSGHIGRKIASTLASTGTPAFFVHPAEASHGDLGMVTKADICLLISNSGETRELADLLQYTRRFAIPVIGISSRADSALMRTADYRLTLPPAPEACPMGLAPTTSTTLTLALGDALAVALMGQRAFVAEEFKTFHPGGKLGAQLLYVHQVMHGAEALATVTPDTRMPQTLLAMSAKGFGIACVQDDAGALVGVISDGDIRRNAARLNEVTAGEIATPAPKTVRPDMLAARALEVMNTAMIGAVVVVDEAGAPIGILRVHDCLRAGVA